VKKAVVPIVVLLGMYLILSNLTGWALIQNAKRLLPYPAQYQFEPSFEWGKVRLKNVSLRVQKDIKVRADSFSFELHEELRKTFGEAGARQIRYKIARALGRRDARAFHERLGVTDPHMKLALGPVHFAHVGWAFVNIFPESKPAPDETYFLTYSHPYSFEAEAHLSHGLRSKFPVCSMNSGYSSGWCEVSYGVELEAQEITCRAMGHENCIFVMSPPKSIGGFVREYKEKYGVT
jgi:son of sevenless-like protein